MSAMNHCFNENSAGKEHQIKMKVIQDHQKMRDI